MDGKWFLYLFAALLWIDIYGTPRIEKVYKYCVFFCIIYICKALYMLFTNSLSRGGVLMEANYDGYMILIVYCFSDVVRKKRWWNWVITLATLLTFSRTGWCAFFAINMYKLYKKNMLYAVCFIPIILLLVYYGEMIRGESARNMDRFVYWTQAYIYFHNTNFTNILLGTMPGVQLKMEILPEFMWTVELFENMRNLKGVYPFMFHSTYLRLAFTWGIPLATLYLLFLVKKILYGKYSPLKNLCIITIIQSFSLSALTLQNVSFLLFVCFLLALQNDKNIRKYRFMKKNVNTYQ